MLRGSTRNKGKEKDLQQKVRFVVTGFGPFQGVPSNPTTVIASKIVDYLQHHQKREETSFSKEKGKRKSLNVPSFAHLAEITETTIVDTSAIDVNQFLSKWSSEFGKDSATKASITTQSDTSDAKDIITIFLHLGVQTEATTFLVERFAYNMANFRVPDERQFQPQRQRIDPSQELDCPRETILDVVALVEALNAKNESRNSVIDHQHDSGAGIREDRRKPILARVSNDPGRFVCNYTYYSSLTNFQCHTAASTIHNGNDYTLGRYRSLFFHVPSFEVAPEEEQLAMVATLMQCIYTQVTAPT